MGWKNGIFVFKDRALSDIMMTLQRWYGVKVIFKDAGLEELKYTGELERYDNINSFLELLEKLERIHYEIERNTITLFK